MTEHELKQQAQSVLVDTAMMNTGDVLIMTALVFCLLAAWVALRPPTPRSIARLSPPEAFLQLRAGLDAGNKREQRKFLLGYWEGI